MTEKRFLKNQFYRRLTPDNTNCAHCGTKIKEHQGYPKIDYNQMNCPDLIVYALYGSEVSGDPLMMHNPHQLHSEGWFRFEARRYASAYHIDVTWREKLRDKWYQFFEDLNNDLTSEREETFNDMIYKLVELRANPPEEKE